MTAVAAAYSGLSPSQRLIAAIALAFANFMVILDLTIANVAVPHIASSLGITLEQGTWIITSYAVAEAICVPLTGWMAGRFGSVRKQDRLALVVRLARPAIGEEAVLRLPQRLADPIKLRAIVRHHQQPGARI